MSSHDPELRPGTVREAVGGVYEVELRSGEVVQAALRGRIKKEDRSGDRVVAGDRVLLRFSGDDTPAIESVEPRVSLLAREAPGRGGHRLKPIVANVDQVVPVFSAANPDPRLRMLDRFLVLAEMNGLPAVIVVNKVELVGEHAARATFADYERAGYTVLLTSVKAGIGLDALSDRVCGATSVFTGPSGVGKSSLLNALEPGLGLRTGEVSEVQRKGKHTTVAARLIPLGCGGYVVDTPGLRELGLWGLDLERLDEHFPEFEPYRGDCRFGSDCSHTHEPSCGVRAALEDGSLSAERYDSYRALYEGRADV